MIMKFLQKVPAGLMLVPLLIGAVIHTLFPQALEIGGLTTAAFSNAGAAMYGTTVVLPGNHITIEGYAGGSEKRGYITVI